MRLSGKFPHQDISQMKNVEQDRVWIVTGASRGIGLAVAECAAEAGARVVLIARGHEVTDVAKQCGP